MRGVRHISRFRDQNSLGGFQKGNAIRRICSCFSWQLSTASCRTLDTLPQWRSFSDFRHGKVNGVLVPSVGVLQLMVCAVPVCPGSPPGWRRDAPALFTKFRCAPADLNVGTAPSRPFATGPALWRVRGKRVNITMRRNMGCLNVLLARYVPIATLGRPKGHPTHCLHSDCGRARAARRPTLRGRPQAFRKRHRSNARASLAFLASSSVRLGPVPASPTHCGVHPAPRSSPDPPRYRTASLLRPCTEPAGLRVTGARYHSTRSIFR